MRQTLVGQIFNSIADAGRDLLDLGPGKQKNQTIETICRDLLTQKGEASGMALAREVVIMWGDLNDAGRLAFMEFLLEEVSLSTKKVDAAVKAYEADKNHDTRRALAAALEAPRQELMRRINFAPGERLRLWICENFLSPSFGKSLN